MGISDNNNSFNPNAPGVKKPVSIGRVTVPPVSTSAPLNQIRGTAAKGSTGAGIPKHVTNVSATIANAVAGSTSTVTVTFKRDPSDSSFGHVNIFVKGYQSNQSLVQIAGGSESPVTFILNSTGEPVSLVVQAEGNAGAAPLTTAPSVGIQLPKATGGGYGTSAVVSPPTQLTGDVQTAGTKSPLAATVVGIEGVGVSNATPNKGDILRFNLYGDSKWDIASAVPRSVQVWNDTSSGPQTIGAGDAPVTVGTATVTGSAGTEPPGRNYTSAATASVNVTAGVRQGWGANLGTNEVFTWGFTFRFSMRVRLNNTTNCRYWIGCSQGTTGDFTGSAGLAVDNPNRIYAAFRYSAGTDTNIKAVCGVSSASQTIVDTGIAPDVSASHLFEIAWIAGSSFRFYIDGALVATITTNLPVSTDRFGQFVCSDNRNTATAVGFAFFNSVVTLR